MIRDVEIEAAVIHRTFQAIRMLIENTFECVGLSRMLLPTLPFIACTPHPASFL